MKIIASATIALAAVPAATAADMPLPEKRCAELPFWYSLRLRRYRELLSVRQSWREAYLRRQFDEVW
jgi:hypothetical protein